MARPLSEEKRAAILDAATTLVANVGPGAATAAIAKGAGVAEGTLFTYFGSKDELLNALYVSIKTEFAEALMRGHPAGRPPRDRFEHIWNRYVEYGAAYRSKRRALRQLAVSDRISDESRAIGATRFKALLEIIEGGQRDGILTAPSVSYLLSIMESMIETTVEFMAANPSEAERYRAAGFASFWAAITAH